MFLYHENSHVVEVGGVAAGGRTAMLLNELLMVSMHRKHQSNTKQNNRHLCSILKDTSGGVFLCADYFLCIVWIFICSATFLEHSQ